MGTVSALERAGLGALKRTASAYDRLRPPGRGIVVLCYHRVGRRSNLRVDLPAWLFEEQLVRLTGGSGVIDLDTALGALGGDAPPGPDPVAITFDDGTADFIEVALPILQRHRVPATLYVATDFVDRGRHFPADGQPASWSALADALSTGLVTIGSHTHSHALLDRLPAREVPAELDRSIELIGSKLGIRVRHFAYPKALPGTSAADREVRSRFVSAALAGTVANRYHGTDPHRLARSPVQVTDGLSYFDLKAKGGMRLEDDLRRLANRRRLAGARY